MNKIFSISLRAILMLMLSGVSLSLLAAVTCSNENVAVLETTPTADFVDNGNGTVTHQKTGLVWMRCSLGQAWDSVAGSCTGTASTYTWQGALQAAEIMNVNGGYAGQIDWRLANKNELISLIERRCWSPSLNEAIFPNTPINPYWSSSPNVNSPLLSWFIDYSTGRTGVITKTNLYHVRLVRGGR